MRATERNAGFTLIEVMAAVAILAVSYTFLSRQGIEGLLWEGEADRLLRASLVADGWLADLEIQQQLGAAPVVGRVEQTSDEFTVVVEVTPFQAPPGLLPPEPPAGGGPGTPATPAAGGGAGAPASLLAPTRGGEPSPLRTIELTVSWNDGRTDRSLRRTTFVLDAAAVAERLAAAGVGEPPAPPAGESP